MNKIRTKEVKDFQAEKLVVNGRSITHTPVRLARYSSAQEAGLVPVTGMLIYNTTAHKVRVYTGAGWEDLC